MISTGTARKNSTNTAQVPRMAPIGDNRPTLSNNPRINASTMDSAAAVRVPVIPGNTYVRHRSAVRNGFHFTAAN